MLVGRRPDRPRDGAARRPVLDLRHDGRGRAAGHPALTGIAIPPEMLGTHVASPESHQTHRTTSLPFRAITALFGHAGIEWDLTSASTDGPRAPRELVGVLPRESRAAALGARGAHRAARRGTRARRRGARPSAAIFCYAQVAAAGGVSSGCAHSGLDPDAQYHVRRVEPAGRAPAMQHADRCGWTG